MWVVVTGPTASGKKFVVDHFIRDGYELYDDQPKSADTRFEQEAYWMLSRAKVQVKAARARERKDIITVRTVFDSRDIFIPYAYEKTYLNDRDHGLLSMMAEIYDDNAFNPPHALILMTTPLQGILNYAKLNGEEITEDEIRYQIDAYKKFAEKVRIPVIEIDASKKAEQISQDIAFYMNSLKSAALGGGSVWQKTFFREQ